MDVLFKLAAVLANIVFCTLHGALLGLRPFDGF
jgi:hypothetical protein